MTVKNIQLSKRVQALSEDNSFYILDSLMHDDKFKEFTK